MQDRKTLDGRAKMTELERLRHSAAHVMATAILRLWPDAPLWLALEQVRVMTIGDDAQLVGYAKQIVNELRGNFVRAESDFSSNKINGKIQEAEQAKVHTMLVIGGRDMEAGNVSVRLHGKGNLGAKLKAEVIADIFAAIKERQA
jgi:threonyl-tRNA synthetase